MVLFFAAHPPVSKDRFRANGSHPALPADAYRHARFEVVVVGNGLGPRWPAAKVGAAEARAVDLAFTSLPAANPLVRWMSTPPPAKALPPPSIPSTQPLTTH